MDSAIERGETVIGHHDQVGCRESAFCFTDARVHGPVSLEQFIFMLCPQHMGVLIDRREVEEQKTAWEMMQGIAKQPLFVVENEAALTQKFWQCEDALPQRGSVLGDPERGVTPGLLRHSAAERRRRGNGKNRRDRVNIDGRDVQLKARVKLSDKNAEHAARRDQMRYQREIGSEPAGPFPLANDR